MIKVVDNFTEGRPYREFVIGLIGSALVTAVLFVITVFLLIFMGYMRTYTGIDLTRNMSVFHAILHFWSEVSLQMALLIATVIGSLFQYYVSKRTIAVLPRAWLYATVAAFVLGLVLNYPALHNYALSAKEWPALTSDYRSHVLGGLPISTMPLVVAFLLMAVAQGASLVRYGILNAASWSVGSLGVLGVLVALNKVPAYPLIQAILAMGLCYWYWRQKDPRKRYAD